MGTAAAPAPSCIHCGAGIADGVRGHHLPGCVRLFCRGLSVPSGARFFQPETGKAVLALKKDSASDSAQHGDFVNRALLGCGMVSLAVVLVLSAPAGRLMAKIMRAIYG